MRRRRESNTPGINWFIGINACMVEEDIKEHGLPDVIPPSLREGFVRWAAMQRIEYEADLQLEAIEYSVNTYAKNLSWLNNKNKGKLFSVVSARDGCFCVKCHSTDDLTLDHIVPRSKGGSDDKSNLQILCRCCNSSKGNS
jgi:hypothetical protein